MSDSKTTRRELPASATQTLPKGSHWERPPKQQGNNLNVILLVADTFRADNLAAYGSDWIETPNLNRLAEESVVFEDAYPEGMPTIPARRQLYTGRRVVPTRAFFQHEGGGAFPGWHHLYNEDVTLSEVLTEASYQTALIADVPHLQRPGRNFHRGYKYYEWVRGQETDPYTLAPRRQPEFLDLFPADYLECHELHHPNAKPGETFRDFLNQYTANRKRWRKDGASIVEQTARNAIRWLRENHQEAPFFLHVEAFDPHEPWHPPQDFLEKYLKDPKGPSWPQPPYANIAVPPEGAKRLRANYAGEASNVDYWVGKILETATDLNLLDNTIVVFLSDHGALLGEQGQFLKGAERLRTQVTHVPLLVRLPSRQFAGRKVKGFVELTDVVPTILGRLNLKSPSRVTGRDLWPFILDEKRNGRDHVVQGFGWIAAVRTLEWNYSAVWSREKYVGEYAPQLYDTRQDPQELTNVAREHPAVVKDLQAKLERYIASGWDITDGSFFERVT